MPTEKEPRDVLAALPAHRVEMLRTALTASENLVRAIRHANATLDSPASTRIDLEEAQKKVERYVSDMQRMDWGLLMSFLPPAEQVTPELAADRLRGIAAFNPGMASVPAAYDALLLAADMLDPRGRE